MTRIEHKTFRAGWTRLILALAATLLAPAVNADVAGVVATADATLEPLEQHD